jgi:hypothetical protein
MIQSSFFPWFFDHIAGRSRKSRNIVLAFQAIWVLCWGLFSLPPAAILISASLIVGIGGIVDRMVPQGDWGAAANAPASHRYAVVMVYSIFILIIFFETIRVFYEIIVGNV